MSKAKIYNELSNYATNKIGYPTKPNVNYSGAGYAIELDMSSVISKL